MNGVQAMGNNARSDRSIEIQIIHNNKEVAISVTDTGSGLDADKIDYIFEPLATWKPDGTGMGLAISNSIVESHGGRMWAENGPEGGAIIGFTLPLT
jgi:signal transduction histidine kinase